MEWILQSLKYFKRTAELQHLTKTAEELHIAQSALSRTIINLENDLGAQLFDRHGRNITLNDNGRILLRHTDNILQELQNTELELEEAKKNTVKPVVLSLASASKLITNLIIEFHEKYPDIRFQLLMGAHEDDNAEYDFAVYTSLFPVKKDNEITLARENIALAISPNHPLANSGPVPLTSFSRDKFIALKHGRDLRNITDHYCRLAGFTPDIAYETDSPETMRDFIRHNLGVSFFPESTWKGLLDNNVSLVPISFPECCRYIILKWKKNMYFTEQALIMRDYIIENFPKLVQ